MPGARVAAAPHYLEKHGAPNTPDEVVKHRAILAGPAANSEWTFNRGDEQVTVRPVGNLSITGSEVGINAGLAGLGMVVASYPSLRGYIGNGELVRLLPEWEMADIESHALFASGQAAKPAARTFVDYLQLLLKSF